MEKFAARFHKNSSFVGFFVGKGISVELKSFISPDFSLFAIASPSRVYLVSFNLQRICFNCRGVQFCCFQVFPSSAGHKKLRKSKCCLKVSWEKFTKINFKPIFDEFRSLDSDGICRIRSSRLNIKLTSSGKRGKTSLKLRGGAVYVRFLVCTL